MSLEIKMHWIKIILYNACIFDNVGHINYIVIQLMKHK